MDEPDERDPPRMLRRIARLLDVPPESFFAAEPGEHRRQVTSRPDDGREAQVLLRLFLALDDPAARERCLAFVRGEAGNGG